MAREKKIGVAALNVVTQPHSPERYISLFKTLHAMRRPVAFRGTQHLMLGDLSPVKRDAPLSGLSGRFYRFDQIDPNAPWFNVDNQEIATEDEMAEVSIPESLKPNLVMFDFVFLPVGHRLYIETKSSERAISPLSVKKLLDTLCSFPAIAKEFGKIEITIIPDKEQLEAILGLHRLTKLSIDVKRPNPDDLADDEERVFRRLDGMGTRRIVQVLTAEPGNTIQPDDEVKLLARVAANNGLVAATGYSAAGDRVMESTVNRPWQMTVHYDPNLQTPLDAMIEGVTAEHANR